ncbi:hypothetical protein PVAND_004193 [Polypedilum vanderplanki]|uniref:Uncharacterized protein n=1 Tax=Polypedilum vanderplanki TaxID=319348 RepID=A0A9J6BXF5_POLVA|nr:hypothetical protein PVAND_004193 [Polypedilum vanderplanki]
MKFVLLLLSIFCVLKLTHQQPNIPTPAPNASDVLPKPDPAVVNDQPQIIINPVPPFNPIDPILPPFTMPSPVTKTPVPKSDKFSVVASNTIRCGKPYTVYIRGFDLKNEVSVKIVLESSDGIYKEEKSAILKDLVPKSNLDFNPGSWDNHAEADSYSLTVSSGDYSETKTINYEKKENAMFIQTNKAIFKPSDIIKYRIFSIDSESNAYTPKRPVIITLTDPRNHEIGKLDNITFINGKFESEWLLPSKPILGTWKLTVQYGKNSETVEKRLTVDEYVLSLFTASLSVPSQVSYSSSQFPITINAEYTFKQPISGTASITIFKNNGDIYTKNVICNSKSTTFYVNFVKDLGYTTSSYYYASISLVFIDPKTNTKATDQASVSIVPYAYNLQFINENIYRPGQVLPYTLISKTLDDKPAPNVKVSVQINNYQTTLITGKDGTVKSSYKTNASDPSYLSIYGTCPTCNSGYSYANPIGLKPAEGISLTLITQNPSYRNKVYILATSAEKISEFYYFVTSKGVLLESRKVSCYEDGNPDNDFRTVEFAIMPNFSYAPNMYIYAYYYKPSDFKFLNTNLFVSFKQELPNTLKINLKGADSTGNVVIKPGSSISMSIQSKPLSVVSLAAVDQRVLQLASTQNFTYNEVFSSFNQYGSLGPIFFNAPVRKGFFNYDYYNAYSAGLVFLSNIPVPQYDFPPGISFDQLAGQENIKNKFTNPSPGPASNIKVRKDFSEVFLFEDVALGKTTSSLTINRQVPDSITSYLIYGVSMNEKDGLGLPVNLPSATIYLPFFISLELPPSVKRGETLTLNIQIFNYLGSTQTAIASVVINPMFEVVNASNNGWTSSKGKIFQSFKVANGQDFTAKLLIKPKNIGVLTLDITAQSSSAGDAIQKSIRVIPEGIFRSITTSVLIAIDKNKTSPDQTLKCELPASAYVDTAEVSATVIGDILGKALNNLENLIMMPGGCGEQNMIGFVPDYAVLNYLKVTGKITPTLQQKLIQYLTFGYQNQLNYQRNDGSFSAFGNNDPNGSTWLSTYVAWYFYLASKYISIDSIIIEKAVNFTISQQNSDGSFKEPGRVIHTDMQGGASNGTALTAYIAIAFTNLVDSYPYIAVAGDLAIQYLEQKLPSISDTYTLAIVANALDLAASASAQAAYDSFYALKIETATQIHWSVPAPVSNNFYYAPRSLDIEVTAYGLILLVNRNIGLGTSLKAVNFLTEKSNSFGGYSSSQDTVVALIALSTFSLKYTLSQTSVNLKLTPNAGNSFNAQVNGTNSLILQTFPLNSATRQLIVHPNSESIGVAVVSLICNFYEDPTKVIPSYSFTYNFDGSCQWRLQMEVCAYLINGNSSNMALMEIKMPSGYYYYDAWWINNQNSDISKIETYEDYTVVDIYFNSISSKRTCVTFGAGKSYDIVGLKPGTIVVNDYYDTSKQGSTSFSIPTNVQNVECKIINFNVF